MLADKYEIEKEVRRYGEFNDRIDRYVGSVHITKKIYKYDNQTVTITYINGFISKVEIE